MSSASTTPTIDLGALVNSMVSIVASAVNAIANVLAQNAGVIGSLVGFAVVMTLIGRYLRNIIPNLLGFIRGLI